MFHRLISVFGLYFVFSETIVSSAAHFTTNSNDLQNLFDHAKNSEVLTSLTNFIETEEDNLQLLKHLSELLVHDEPLKATKVKRPHHPRNVLEIIRWHALPLPAIIQEIQERARTNVFDDTMWNEFMSLMPNSSALSFFIKGLVRLMDVYDLEAISVKTGYILRHVSRGLNLDEIADIGLVSTEHALSDAVSGDMVSVIMDWLYLGSSLAEDANKIDLRYKFEVAVLEIVRFMLRRDNCQCSTDMETAHTIWIQNNPGHSLPTYNWTCDVNQKPGKCQKNINKNTKEHENFFNLCQHKQAVHFKEKHIHLPVEYQYCKLDHNNHPWLILQPIKVEIRSPEHPYNMIEFHDILSENEMDYLKLHAESNMTRGSITIKDTPGVISDIRIGEASHLPQEKHDSPIIRRILTRLSAISNLTLTHETLEKVRLANYATTGYFASHVDFYFNRKTEENNRFVTFLLYLNDVDGGETVFPFINMRMDARRGRALMFNNLFKNTIGMLGTRHGSCPVITGDKWIVALFVHKFGHEFSHKCSLNQFK